MSFIDRHKDQPFFLYVPHAMVHVPLHVSDKFRGKTQRGLFGDVVEEVDWSVGQILAAIKKNGLDEQTLVMFCSDNGPWLCYGDHAGSPARCAKAKAPTGTAACASRRSCAGPATSPPARSATRR